MSVAVEKVYHLLLLLFFIKEASVLNNGLALTPPMGWMSWGYYECSVNCSENPQKCLNEKLIMDVADHMYEDGYLEAGYEYIVIDDCWSEMKRSDNGLLVPDRQRFPRGIKFLADYVHSKGLKFGMYTNVAAITCKGYPGSLGYFDIDARTFAEWEIDYLKVDGCFVGEEYLNSAYISFGEALNKTGRPIVYSCSWPYYIEFIHKHVPNFAEVSEHCNLWRNYHDIAPTFGNLYWTIRHYKNITKDLSQYHGPGHWFDPDMLLVGRGVLTPNENRIQIGVYAMLSAPFLISCDMNRINEAEKDLLLNLDLIAIAQDKMGLPAKPFELQKHVTMWFKPHHPRKGDKYPSYSLAFVNMRQNDILLSYSLKQLPLNSTDNYSVLDIFKKQYQANVTSNDTLDLLIPAIDIVLYSLYPL